MFRSTSLVLTLGLAAATPAVSQSTCVFVPSTANIYSAGLSAPLQLTSGGGTLAVEISLANLPSPVSFGGIGGVTSCCGGTFETGPEGATSCCSTSLDSFGGISGMVVSGRSMYLAGVFLGDAAPGATAPPVLDFSGATDFASVAPELGQSFFIGDGFAGGVAQEFIPPPGATRLFLGMLDGFSFSGTPGYYSDNLGGYVLDIGGGTVGSAFCACPASAAPCGNASAHGCANSAGAGARLVACGSASLAADNLEFVTLDLPPNEFGLLFVGGATASAPFGDGQLCVASGATGLRRFDVKAADSTGTYVHGPGLVRFNAQNHAPQGRFFAGQTYYFQSWYRDGAGPCGQGFSLSDGQAVTFAP